LSLAEVRSLSFAEIDVFRRAWKTKIKRQYYIAGRVGSGIMLAIFSVRGMFTKNAPQVKFTEYDLFPEIEMIESEERKFAEADRLKEEEENKKALSPGAQAMLLHRNVYLLKERQLRLEKHNARVRELQKNGG
jgi:hypothetical protein